MLTITNKSREFTEVELYLMTSSPNVITMKDVPDGTEITVDGFLEFHDDGNGGAKEATDIMSIIDPDMKCYAFQSATLKRTVHELAAIYKDKQFTIVKTTGLSKKRNKEFINAYLKVDVAAEKAKKHKK